MLELYSCVCISVAKILYFKQYRLPIRSVVRSCLTCRKVAAKPSLQVFGQLPADSLIPRATFECIEIDYAGPMMVQSGLVGRPVLKKA